MSDVSQLVLQLPHAQNTPELFGMVAAVAKSMFEELQHISIMLLPQQPSSHSAAATNNNSSTPQHTATAAAGKGSSGRAPGTAESSSTSSKTGTAAKHVGNNKEQGTLEPTHPHQGGHGLDWSNCCVYHLLENRGPVVQPAASWPVACTASCYAAVSARSVVATDNLAADGPHFLDWKYLAERGCVSMAAVPMFSSSRPVAVLTLASQKAAAFSDQSTLKLLGSAVAPYCSRLSYTTRRAEMQRLVNEVITPIAAQLAQQKHNRLAQLGCSVQEAPPGTVPADGKGISVAVGAQGAASSGNSASTSKSISAKQSSKAGTSSNQATALVRRKRHGTKSETSGSNGSSSVQQSGRVAGQEVTAAGVNGSSRNSTGSITHKRFESVIVKGEPYTADSSYSSAPPSDLELDWSDFFFNMVSMVIVYVYFSKTAVTGENLVAIVLCMGVAAFDILLLAMRWLWFEQYLNHGNLVLNLFHAYRAVVLPIANTWMSWSLLNRMSVTPSWPVITLLGVLLVACIIVGLQVRFFLHAPLQLASVLFAAMSTPDICKALLNSASSLKCVGLVSAVQVALGLVLPSILVCLLEGRQDYGFLPHMQAKRWP